MLDKEGIPTNQNKTWRESAVHYILTNERYIGDSLWQKSYTTDTFPVTRCKNKGLSPRKPSIRYKSSFSAEKKPLEKNGENNPTHFPEN